MLNFDLFVDDYYYMRVMDLNHLLSEELLLAADEMWKNDYSAYFRVVWSYYFDYSE